MAAKLVIEESCLNSQGRKSVCITQGILEGWGLENVCLHQFQLKGVQWLVERLATGHGCILGDEMGLGKTLQSISLLVYLHRYAGSQGPFLILVPLSVIQNWESELSRFYPHFKVLDYSGGKEKREELRNDITAHLSSQGRDWAKATFPFHVMLAHYDVAIRDSAFLTKFPWQCLVVDEGHRLKSSSSVLYKQLQERCDTPLGSVVVLSYPPLSLKVKHCVILTGTPVQNNLSELYSLLSFVAPKIFPLSKSAIFISDYSNVKEDMQVAASLHNTLKPFLLRRLKSEVLLDLPVKSEVILYTGLSAIQKKLYKALLMKDHDAFNSSGKKTRLLNILCQLRKCVNHPYLFDGVEPEPFELGEHIIEASGKLFLLDKMLSHLKLKGHRVLLFSQMTRMLDVIQDYLGFRAYSYERLDGSVRGEERFIAIQNFTDNEETFIFLLSTRAGGQGINLVGADTIVFIDSDYNPQSDLQAAARAHRIGQTRPVKIVRLISRHTVEEIVLQRAHSKLDLTNIVIEGGQFSGMGGASAVVGDSLSDILKFGLDHLLQSSSSTIIDEDLESVLGCSEGGEWVVDSTEDPVDSRQVKGDKDDEAFHAVPQSIYAYEGKDYSKPSEADRKTFDQMLAEVLMVEGDQGERVLRSEHHVPQLALMDVSMLPSRKRKTLTPQQLEERRKEREENRIKRMKVLEEKEQQKLEEKKRKLLQHWKRSGYTSMNIPLGSSSEEEEEEEEVDIKYVVGDVTLPQCRGNEDAIVVHCVDDSGDWGKGGLFSAISTRSTAPQAIYEEAGHMRDLSLGDAHLVAIDDVISSSEGKDKLALIVAQTRVGGKGGHVSAIKLSALSMGFSRVARLAKKSQASVHLPRIGHSTPLFNWYGTERLIRKHFSSRGICTVIYYYKVSHSQAHPSTSSGRGTLSPRSSSACPFSVECDPLPDVFSGLVFAFAGGFVEEERVKWSRYIIAYDGEVREEGSPGVAYLVCEKDEDPPCSQDIEVRRVCVHWLEKCLGERKIVPIE